MVIVYRDLDGDVQTMNAWPVSRHDLTTYPTTVTMAETLDPKTAPAKIGCRAVQTAVP